MVNEDKIGGGCHCGCIRYTLSLPTIHQTHCHCDICRSFGGTLMSWVTVKNTAFSMSGSTIRTYRSSASAYREFCSECGSHLTFRADESPEFVDISLGTFDHPEMFPPDNQIWGEDRLSCLDEMNELTIKAQDGSKIKHLPVG